MIESELPKPMGNDIYGALTFYREVGYYMKRLEQFQKSLKYFDEAVNQKKDDYRTLRGRAVALAQSCKYTEAMKDVEEILKVKPDDIYAHSIQAIVLFLRCDFAKALIVNKRFSKYRKQPTNFVMGLMHCADAIENSIGRRAGHPLRNHYKYVRRIGWRIAIAKHKPWAPIPKHKRVKKKEVIVENQPVMPKRKIKLPLLRSHSKTKGSKRSLHKRSDTTTGQKVAATAKLHGSRTETQSEASDSKKKIPNADSKQSSPRTEATATPRSVSRTDHGEESGRLYAVPSMSCPLFEIGSSIEDTLHSHVDSATKIPKMGPYPYRPLQNYTTNIRNYMAENYLDKMYLDKIFLKSLPKNLGISTPNEEGSNKIKFFAKRGFKFIDYNQELLRARRPFYGIKFRSTKISERMRDRQEGILNQTKHHCSKKAESLVDDMKKTLDAGEIKDLIDLAEKLKMYCQNTPRKFLPLCDKYLNSLYNMMCDGYYNSVKFTDDMTDLDKANRVHLILGLPLPKEPSHDKLFTQFKNVFWDYQKMTIIHEERLLAATDIDEVQWLYYDLARFQIELKKYDLAKAYLSKCMKEAYKVKNYKWILNGFILTAKADVLLKDKNSAKVTLRQAEKVVKKLKDPKMLEVLEWSKDIINNTILAETLGIVLIQRRQKRIINMLRTQKMKDDAAHLFRTIEGMSVERRMSVIPGILYEIDKVDSRADVVDTEGDRGSAFMKLIEYHLD